MSARNLVLTDLTPAHLEHFWECDRQNGIALSTMYSHRCLLHKYLFWLAQKGFLRFVVEPPRMRHMRMPLPRLAMRFLELPASRRQSAVVRCFHSWLHRKHIALDELTPAHIEAFVRKPIGVELGKTSRELRLHDIEPYLLWLHDRGRLGFRLERKARTPLPIPAAASGFVDTLRPVLRSTTCKHYVSDLRDFLAWLAVTQLDIDQFDRTAAERWLKSLADRGLGPITRGARILHVRRYLGWLSEKGELAACPDDLLRNEDLPKLPSYLPRPFPIDADRELQRRFLDCGNTLGRALFLMRRSGVRIGELVRFEPRCLERDLHGNAFIKVPLGKLDNERLVPPGDEARQVLEALQRQCPRSAEFLILPELSRSKLKVRLSAALKEAGLGLDIPGPVVSHRLRHTYATELLNAGMSLVTIMKLLGHRSFRMTMRYAAIAQRTVVDDYHAAVAKAARNYDTAASTTRPAGEVAPERLTLDLISCLRRVHGSSADHRHRLEALIKRIYKLHDDILSLPPSPRTP
jgi:site-specific recombinase XerD